MNQVSQLAVELLRLGPTFDAASLHVDILGNNGNSSNRDVAQITLESLGAETERPTQAVSQVSIEILGAENEFSVDAHQLAIETLGIQTDRPNLVISQIAIEQLGAPGDVNVFASELYVDILGVNTEIVKNVADVTNLSVEIFGNLTQRNIVSTECSLLSTEILGVTNDTFFNNSPVTYNIWVE